MKVWAMLFQSREQQAVNLGLRSKEREEAGSGGDPLHLMVIIKQESPLSQARSQELIVFEVQGTRVLETCLRQPSASVTFPKN